MTTVITMVKMGATIGATTQGLQTDKVKVREGIIILPKVETKRWRAIILSTLSKTTQVLMDSALLVTLDPAGAIV